MAKSNASPSRPAPADFESAMKELEEIVHAMEAGGLSLEASLDAYQRGMTLLKHCQDQISAAEQKVRMLENGVLRDLPSRPDEQAD